MQRRLVSVTSTLTVKAMRTDDLKQYTCRASHPALQHPALPLAASLTISVLRFVFNIVSLSCITDPPNPPIITGYRTGEVLRAGERRILPPPCRVVGGNPGGLLGTGIKCYPITPSVHKLGKASISTKRPTVVLEAAA
ncbi:hypothetical protein GWK47_030474 [Chionoecetes opilio]|uniref:Ig-like domain-containing protein n=1 Tax=Chionoecetes opilio TaxID=41210 RepID=A0A8J4YRR4_CHIOP|nr:hypothetical protein GWK47_030474 [Chionoecetes opilio]